MFPLLFKTKHSLTSPKAFLKQFPLLLLFTILHTSTLFTQAEQREWSNADKTKSFLAEFVAREGNQITLTREDGKTIIFDVTKLHHSDQKWLFDNHPADGPAETYEATDESVFDTLNFGDNRTLVARKLAASKMVESSVDGAFQGRTGLNGIYRTRGKIGGLYCYLFFDWTPDGGLKEITLRTEGKPRPVYITELKPCWAELTGLIAPIHGRPIHTSSMPSPNNLEDGQILGSHLWRIDNGGTVLLGAGREGNNFQVVVRFTTEDLALEEPTAP